LTKTDLAGALDRWLQGELNKNKSANVAYEKFECLHVLCFHPAASNLGQAIAFAEDLFKRSGPIQLFPATKPKGLNGTLFSISTPGEYRRSL
jgi:hypothetical protein